jgi:hypothetical protein
MNARLERAASCTRRISGSAHLGQFGVRGALELWAAVGTPPVRHPNPSMDEPASTLTPTLLRQRAPEPRSPWDEPDLQCLDRRDRVGAHGAELAGGVLQRVALNAERALLRNPRRGELLRRHGSAPVIWAFVGKDVDPNHENVEGESVEVERDWPGFCVLRMRIDAAQQASQLGHVCVLHVLPQRRCSSYHPTRARVHDERRRSGAERSVRQSVWSEW